METDVLQNKLWERINHNSRPHEVFKLDWSTYYSLDFADTFLPHADGILGKALWMYDGADLFNNLRTTDSKQFKFDSNKIPINLISYSYPSAVAAANARDLVQVSENEICSFFEVQENNDINIYFKFGNNFIGACERNFAKEKINFRGLQGKAFKTNVETFKSFFNSELVHYNIMQFILSTIGIKDLTNLYKLESVFAQEQLKQIAKEMGKIAFGIFMLTVFGEDIEIKALYKLYDSLLNDSIEPPTIVVTQQPLKDRKANYDAEKKQIVIEKFFIDESLTDEKVKAELLIAMVQEYGRYIDNLLRTNYNENKKEVKDYLDEGAKFAFFFLTKTSLQLKDIKYAKIDLPYYNGELITSFDIVKQQARKIDSNTNYLNTKNVEKLEDFGAGFEPGMHGGIELEALGGSFSREEIYNIYYGNWLRDYSQVLVGATVRLTSEAKKLAEQTGDLYILDTLKKSASRMSHEGWVELLEILAAQELMFGLYNEGKFCHQYTEQLKLFREKYGALTKDILGVYRPEEHIDNPKGLQDESKLPISFDYEYPKGSSKPLGLYAGETKESLEIDNKFNLKKYIVESISLDRPSSDLFVVQQINLAIEYGKTKEGFRHLGAALHVIEDYFSHTNFVEVALIKAGTKNKDNDKLKIFMAVYPWVEDMQDKDYTTIPIVTGIFLTDDTLASVLPKMADKMFPVGFEKYEQRMPGDRTFGDAFILTLFKDLSKAEDKEVTYFGFTAAQLLEAYGYHLWIVDSKSELIETLGPVGTFFDKLLQRVGETFSSFNNLAFNLFLQPAGEEIKEIQTTQTNKNYGTNPTHTQIAKDPLNHPLNKLAADLAFIAIKDIGARINTIWETGKDDTAKGLAYYIINTYTKHPKDTTFEEVRVKKWAEENTKSIAELSSKDRTELIEKVIKRAVDNTIFEKLIF
jgi:Heterokaryon incompatibility protein Het-C